ncbi:MAG: DUF4336 domain-containing protein [Myxococcales bacterium]|nr:DUF4336 domain-containing protein [Myxococcales bacterium]
MTSNKRTVRPICDGLWELADELSVMGMRFPLRMTIVALGEGELLLHSPVRIDDDAAREIAELGRVTDIVAPSMLHHVHAGAARERYPEAKLHGAPGLAKKRADLTFDSTLGGEPPASWRGVLDQRLVEGCPKVNEVAFFHRPSRTVLLTDLVFHILEPRGWFTRLMMRLVGAYKRFVQSKLWRRFTKDREAARASVEAILSWDIERVVMCHGVIVDDNAKARLTEALWWMRGVERRAATTASAV